MKMIGPVDPSRGAVRPLGLRDVRLVDGFWAERQRLNVTTMLPHCMTWIERAGWLTPYVAQSIGEDARRAGQGARLELGVGSGTSDAHLARVVEQFAWLSAHGIDVKVSRKPGAEAA